jgi:hypothetical protein
MEGEMKWLQKLIDLIRGKQRVTIAPAPEPPVEAPALMQWFERDGRVVIRLRASLGPRGYSIITAHGHKHIDPVSTAEADWVAANNSRPPHRIVDGWAEWVLPQSAAQISALALSHGRPSKAVVMVFHKTSRTADDGQMHVAHWVNPLREYGTPGGRAPARNSDNKGWQVEL